MTVHLTAHDLTLEQVVRVARHDEPVAFDPKARERMERAHAIVEDAFSRPTAFAA